MVDNGKSDDVEWPSNVRELIGATVSTLHWMENGYSSTTRAVTSSTPVIWQFPMIIE